jgi:hypothetical protein
VALDLENKIYTSDEVADLLRLANRAVIKLAKAHGCCSRYGRSYLFSKPDVLAIWEVLREPMKEPKTKLRDVALSDPQLYASLQKLLRSRKKRKPHV